MADYHLALYEKVLDDQEQDSRSKGVYTLYLTAQEDSNTAEVLQVIQAISPVKSISLKNGKHILLYDSRKDAVEALTLINELNVLSPDDKDYLEQDEKSPSRKETKKPELEVPTAITDQTPGNSNETKENQPEARKEPTKVRDYRIAAGQDLPQIFVGRLPDDITEDELREFFEECHAFNPRITDTEKGKIAFLKAFTIDEAKKTVMKMSGKKLKNRRIIVELTNKTRDKFIDKTTDDDKVESVIKAIPTVKGKQPRHRYRRKTQPKTDTDSVAGMMGDIDKKIANFIKKDRDLGFEVDRLNKERRSIQRELQRLDSAKKALEGVLEDNSEEQYDPDQTVPMVVASKSSKVSSECRESNDYDASQEETPEDMCQGGATGGAEKSPIYVCESEAVISQEMTELQLMTSSQLVKIYKDCVSTLCNPIKNGELPKDLEIVVTHTVDEKYFWGILNNKEYTEDNEKFEALGDQLKETSNHERFIRMEKRCGALYEGTFYRAWVSEISGNTATVLFIDYGNMASVNTNELVGLPSQFWKLRPHTLPFKIADSDYFKLSEDDHYSSIKASTSARREDLEKDMEYVAVLDDVFPLIADE